MNVESAKRYGLGVKEDRFDPVWQDADRQSISQDLRSPYYATGCSYSGHRIGASFSTRVSFGFLPTTNP